MPIFWVGLPPVRTGRNAGDIPFLNELYRSRADKAGIVYVDVWDGFVDEDGRFAQTGPDFEGQTRRLRSGDGVYFTQPGARKLAHFVEKEIDRWLTARPVALAVPADEPKAPLPAPGAGRHRSCRGCVRQGEQFQGATARGPGAAADLGGGG